MGQEQDKVKTVRREPSGEEVLSRFLQTVLSNGLQFLEKSVKRGQAWEECTWKVCVHNRLLPENEPILSHKPYLPVLGELGWGLSQSWGGGLWTWAAYLSHSRVCCPSGNERETDQAAWCQQRLKSPIPTSQSQTRNFLPRKLGPRDGQHCHLNYPFVTEL